MKTIEDAKQWVSERSEELDADRMACEDSAVQMLNRLMPGKAKELWDSSCWLEEQLQSNGATKEQVKSIQFAHGQRSFGGNAWQVAVNYANEFATTGDTEEKGGMELAEKRHEELFGK